jgi:hypothetical protein
VNERKAEMVSYAVACVILVIGGAIFRTPILNWINGPAIVIATVALLTPRLAKKDKNEGSGGDPEE